MDTPIPPEDLRRFDSPHHGAIEAREDNSPGENEAHFAFKAKWKALPGNRYTPEELFPSGDAGTPDIWPRAATEDVDLWPCP